MWHGQVPLAQSHFFEALQTNPVSLHVNGWWFAQALKLEVSEDDVTSCRPRSSEHCVRGTVPCTGVDERNDLVEGQALCAMDRGGESLQYWELQAPQLVLRGFPLGPVLLDVQGPDVLKILVGNGDRNLAWIVT
jgi:hypothetical protein